MSKAGLRMHVYSGRFAGEQPLKPIEMNDAVGGPLTQEDVRVAEEQLGVSFPLDYVTFLLTYNGGHPKPTLFPIAGFPPDNQGVLNCFLGLEPKDYFDLRNVAKVFKDRVPPELLPVGRDVFGNLICLTVSGPNKGTVYWWFHEEEADEGEPPTYDNLYFVANNFSDLLDSLTPEKEDG